MLLSLEIAGRKYAADMARGISLAIPLVFGALQPTFFGAPPAEEQVLESGEWVGDTRRGGSCNVKSYRIVPHCNGTHTESIAHLVDDGPQVHEAVQSGFLPATLVSVTPRDKVIDDKLMQVALGRHPEAVFHKALILRTLPNSEAKLTHRYEGPLPAPYLTVQAMEMLVQAGVEHLLVDFPSLDPAQDEGRMAAHRVFWGMPATGHRLADARRPGGTVTELIYVPEAVADGYYFLDLQIPAFMTDAAPSRPVIYPVG